MPVFSLTHIKFSIIPLAFFALAACATSTGPTYQAASSPSATGYRDTAIEKDRYRVSYRSTNTGGARDYALLRAAELTLAKGYDWFEVVGSDTEQQPQRRNRSSISIGGSTGGYGRNGVGIGIGLPIGGSGRSGSYVSLEIIAHKGTKPEQANAYDAFTVQQNIRRQINAGQ